MNSIALMKKLVIPALTILGFIMACTSSSPLDPLTTSELEKTTTYAFSDRLQLDTFTVTLLGKNSKDRLLLFTIKSFEGKEIYREEIKINALLKNYLATAELKKEDDKLKFLKEEIAYFFDEERFVEPAVTPEEHADKNVPDKAFYEELKQNNLNGFNYRLGKDHKMYIAWSKSEQKVKVYYKCC